MGESAKSVSVLPYGLNSNNHRNQKKSHLQREHMEPLLLPCKGGRPTIDFQPQRLIAGSLVLTQGSQTITSSEREHRTYKQRHRFSVLLEKIGSQYIPSGNSG